MEKVKEINRNTEKKWKGSKEKKKPKPRERERVEKKPGAKRCKCVRSKKK